MKKNAIFGLLVVVVIAGTLRHWQNARTSKFDRDFQQSLAGTWSSELDNMRLTNVIMPGGNFTCHLLFSHSTRTNTYQEAGTWLVKDGKIIETVKSDTNLAALTPRSITGRIIHAEAGVFAVRWGISPDTWTWQRIVQ